jgi:endoglucanase
MKKTSLITVVILMVLMSSTSYSATPAGPLSVSGNKIVDQNGFPVSFAGNSFFWSNWGGGYYNADCVNWLVSDWQTTIVRAAMGIEESGGYIYEPTREKNKVKAVVDAAIAAGIYVIIDWHSHHAEDYQSEAVAFFEEMATTYGGYDNVIYEPYNEPLNTASWSGDVKPYCEAVIAAIRAIDPDNLIIVGSPEWSQRVDLCAADPITGYSNIAYTLHFYSCCHGQWLRDRANAAMNAGIALMVTEWGPIGWTQNDPESDAWMNWCQSNDISHCAWAVNDKNEEWSILDAGIGMYTGGWSDSDLSETGLLERSYIRNWDSTPQVPPPQGQYCPHVIPGQIEVENYDVGGEGVAYHDYDGGNTGGAYRSDDVDLESCSEGGYNVGYIYPNEWLEYTVANISAGTYDIELRVASLDTGGSLHIEFDGVDVTGTINFGATGGWQNWTSIYVNGVSLDAGPQIMRIVMHGGTWNITWVKFVGGTAPLAPTALWATAGNGMVWLNWNDSGEPDLDGYNIYRSTTQGSGYTQLNGALLSSSDYTDNSVSNGTTYYYVVTAVDTFSNESGYSNEDLATPNTGGAEGVYQEADGRCVMEAENATVDQRSDVINWYLDTANSGYAGSGYMTTQGDPDNKPDWSVGCELAWEVDITTAGKYYMAVRRFAPSGNDDSAKAGVDGVQRDDRTFEYSSDNEWKWSRGTDFSLGNLSAGTHTIQIRRREDGFCIDRVLIADSWGKIPTEGSTEVGAPENPTGGGDTTPPAAPTGLAATAGDAQVLLDWADNGEPDLAGYDVHRSTTTGGPYSVIASDLTSSDYTDNSVSNGTTYYYVVTAIDTSTNESGYSNEASATPEADTTPPAAPTGLAATAGDATVSLDWNDNGEGDLDGYNVYRSTTPGSGYSQLNGSLLSSSDYTDNSVSNGTTYYYVVTAVDTSSNESGNSNEASATPTDTTPPAAPTGLAATPGDATVSLDWNDNGESDLDGYNVYRSTTPGGGYSQLNGSLLSSSDYTDNSVSNGTTYYYVVTAVDTSNNESGYSGEASATPQAGPSTVMHVAGIVMSTRTRGKNVNAIATVTVVDADGIPVEGATVSGHWSGLTSDSDSGITVSDGTVSLDSDKVRNANGTFTFTVDNITKAGWTYDFGANVETSDSITVP